MYCGLRFMDTRELREQASLEAARESLIAISYAPPDKAPYSVKTLLNVEVVAQADKADMFRSELISIAHPHSPDTGYNSWNGHA